MQAYRTPLCTHIAPNVNPPPDGSKQHLIALGSKCNFRNVQNCHYTPIVKSCSMPGVTLAINWRILLAPSDLCSKERGYEYTNLQKHNQVLIHANSHVLICNIVLHFLPIVAVVAGCISIADIKALDLVL
jgi:hypothetical protein